MQRFRLILKSLATEQSKWYQKTIVKHIGLAVVITFILLFVIGRILRWYTHHGDTINVPDLTGLTMTEVEGRNILNDFKVIVVDSVYDLEKPKGSIAFQDPPAASVVKRGRTIYLTLVAVLHEQVRMPSLTDMTLRQATAMLETYGLKTGNVDYIPDIAKNAVLKQRHKGRNIEAGSWVEKGSRIDLVVGQGTGGGDVHVPFLLGKKRGEAIESIRNSFFVPGKEVFEDGKDTLHARVYKQSPSYSSRGSHRPGESIDLWYRSEKKFDFDTYLKQYVLDSLRESMDIDSL
ncbi:MAG: PASTA domain-containing protein [Bacteroidales bacterium]